MILDLFIYMVVVSFEIIWEELLFCSCLPYRCRNYRYQRLSFNFKNLNPLSPCLLIPVSLSSLYSALNLLLSQICAAKERINVQGRACLHSKSRIYPAIFWRELDVHLRRPWATSPRSKAVFGAYNELMRTLNVAFRDTCFGERVLHLGSHRMKAGFASKES